MSPKLLRRMQSSASGLSRECLYGDLSSRKSEPPTPLVLHTESYSRSRVIQPHRVSASEAYKEIGALPSLRALPRARPLVAVHDGVRNKHPLSLRVKIFLRQLQRFDFRLLVMEILRSEIKCFLLITISRRLSKILVAVYYGISKKMCSLT